MTVCAFFFVIILLLGVVKVDSYEKTLRKIVRSQSKMVQRPFSASDDVSKDIMWINTSMPERLPNRRRSQFMSGYAQVKKLIHKTQQPRMATIITTVDVDRHKSAYTKPQHNNFTNNVNMLTKDIRLERDVPNNKILNTVNTKETLLFSKLPEPMKNNNATDIAVETYYEIPAQTKPSAQPIEIDKPKQEDALTKEIDNTIVIPENHQRNEANNNKPIIQSIYIANPEARAHNKHSGTDTGSDINSNPDNDKVDYLIEEKHTNPSAAFSSSNYSKSVNTYSCTVVQQVEADIDAQEQFYRFDIEPGWMSNKHFWNPTFDNRYELLMRSPKWPPLKVILIPRTHVDSIWKKAFHKYHNETVGNIISNVVKKLQFYPNLTFTWNEVSHLSHWWKSANHRSRIAFKRLLKSGRLEITTGGWVESDEATTHLFGLVHQLIEGHAWLKNNFNYLPKVAWLSNSVAHSSTMTYLLSAAGIKQLVLANLHFCWEEYLSEYQFSDFMWVQNWDKDKTSPLNGKLNKLGNDRYAKNTVATHFMQFNSDGFLACGPDRDVCTIDFDFAKPNTNLDIHSFNVKEKAELLLEQYSKSGTVSPHNVIMAPIGEPYRYDQQPEFDYQFNNYQKLAEFININRNIYKATVEFGTPKDYFENVFQNHKIFPTLKGDFMNYADLISGSPAYWTGYYTSRPMLKILLRRLESTLRSTEILFSFALNFNSFREFNTTILLETLLKARHTVARLADRNVMSGTLTANAVKYVHRLIMETVKDCWYLQEVAASVISVRTEKRNKVPYLKKYVHRDGEFMSPFRTLGPGDQVYIFNSLNHERTEVVEVVVTNPNIIIVDHNKKDLTIQINPVWKYTANNTIKISKKYFKLIFTVVMPPLCFEIYKIKSTYDATANKATIYCSSCKLDDTDAYESAFQFKLQPIQLGDIQLENYKHRLVFDEITGLIKFVTEKKSNKQKLVNHDYGAFRSSDKNSGMFLFNTNVNEPLHDVLVDYRYGTKKKITLITSGKVATEVINVYGKLLQSTVKIFNLLYSPLSDAILIESKVDYDISPINRELELFMTIHTDINNGSPPEMYTDNNGFQYTARMLNLSRRVESNMYPMTTMAYIQDKADRLTLITDHAQGVTSLQEGNLLAMLDRRVLYNDGRGTGEGLADSSITCHRHYVLLESLLADPGDSANPTTDTLNLPSLSAVQLANSLSYLLDIFIIEKKDVALTLYTFLPLVKISFPCDVSLVNYRVVMSHKSSQSLTTPNTALMILHRQSFSCNIDRTIHVTCGDNTQFSLDKILYNVKAIYKTNLAGTNKGQSLMQLNQKNFPPMELATLRIHF